MAFGLQWERSSNITCRQVEFQHIWKASKYAHKHETENPNQTQPPGVALLDAVPCGFREEGESGRKLILRGERHAHDMVYLYSSTVCGQTRGVKHPSAELLLCTTTQKLLPSTDTPLDYRFLPPRATATIPPNFDGVREQGRFDLHLSCCSVHARVDGV